MHIIVQKVRQQYWLARVMNQVSNKVGEGRTRNEAIGHLVAMLCDEGSIPPLRVTELAPGECANKKIGEF